MKTRIQSIRLIAMVWAWLLVAESISFAQTDSLEWVTGEQTRVVWISQVNGEKKPYEFAIIGYDSRVAKSLPIVEKVGDYTKPLITPDGKQVLFTNRADGFIYAVNWDGTGLRRVIGGNLADVCQFGRDKRIWVYFQANPKDFQNPPKGARSSDDHKGNPVFRIALDQVMEPELVWDKTEIHIDNFQLSADGKFASGLFPWPKGGVASLPNGSYSVLGNGCWTSLAPDNSRMFWIFDGPHRNVYITAASGQKWMVCIGDAPGINGFEVYHPRWSNSPRIITTTGPYVGKGGQPGGNRIEWGGSRVEIYVGRFSPDYKTIDRWITVSRNSVADFFPDVWVKMGEKVSVPRNFGAAEEVLNVPVLSKRAVKRLKTWPGSHEGLLFLWENSMQSNEVQRPDGTSYSPQLSLAGKAIYGPGNSLDLSSGAAFVKDAGAYISEACSKSHQMTLEAYITPKDLKQTGPARIITLSGNTSERNFTVGQEKERLVLRLRTPLSGDNGSIPEITLAQLEAGKSVHLLVSYAPGRLVCYIDGRAVVPNGSCQGDFSNWKLFTLMFGDEVGGGRNWDGRLEGIAIYNRYMGSEEAQKHFALFSDKVAGRRVPETFVVNAVIEKISTAPTPESIAPYRRCLAEYIYRIEGVEKGTISDKRIVVARWVILDGKRVIPAGKVGERQRLTLEKFDDHKELEGERVATEIDEFSLTRFVDMAR